MYFLVDETKESNSNIILTTDHESMNFQRMPYIETGSNVLPDSCGRENRRVWGPVCFSVRVHLNPAPKYLLLLPKIREPLVFILHYLGK